MKISTRTQYGLRLMFQLAKNYGQGHIFLKDIALAEGISEKYLSQIIIPLKNKGLVISFRGAKGGYCLSRSPQMITIKEIVEILEGEINPVECRDDNSVCARFSSCAAKEVWERLKISITTTLSSITLEDMLKFYFKNKKVLMYDI